MQYYVAIVLKKLQIFGSKHILQLWKDTGKVVIVIIFCHAVNLLLQSMMSTKWRCAGCNWKLVHEKKSRTAEVSWRGSGRTVEVTKFHPSKL